MKKFIQFLFLSLLILIFRYIFTLLVVNDPASYSYLSVLSLWKNDSSLVVKIFESINLYADSYLIIFFEALLSTVFFAWALTILDKLLEQLWLFDEKKYYVFLMILVFPASYVFTLPGDSSLFLLLTILSVFYLYKKKYSLGSLLMGLSISLNFWGIALVIPYIFHFVTLERYNEKIKIFPKVVTYLVLTFVPVVLIGIYTNNLSLSYFSLLQQKYSFTFVPFGFLYSLSQNITNGINYFDILNATLLVLLIVVVAKTFTKFFLVFEHRVPEQNTLFLYIFIFTLMLGSITSSVSLFELVILCFGYLICSAIVYNVYMRNHKMLFILFLFFSLQTLFFTQFLLSKL